MSQSSRKRTQQPHYFAFPGGSDGKESAYSAEDRGSIPGSGRSPGEENGYPLQCSGLENSMDPIVHGVAKSQTEQLSLSPNTQKSLSRPVL